MRVLRIFTTRFLIIITVIKGVVKRLNSFVIQTYRTLFFG